MNKEDLLLYKNKDVILRYCKEYNKNEEFANDVFLNLMKWFYVANKCREENFSAHISGSLLEIDNMWHTFIIFTKDYANFCQTYFKKFIHHIPNTSIDNKKIDSDKKSELKRYLEILVAEFGEETLNLWYKIKKYERSV